MKAVPIHGSTFPRMVGLLGHPLTGRFHLFPHGSNVMGPREAVLKGWEPSDTHYNGKVSGNKCCIKPNLNTRTLYIEASKWALFEGNFLDHFQMELTEPLNV